MVGVGWASPRREPPARFSAVADARARSIVRSGRSPRPLTGARRPRGDPDKGARIERSTHPPPAARLSPNGLTLGPTDEIVREDVQLLGEALVRRSARPVLCSRWFDNRPIAYVPAGGNSVRWGFRGSCPQPRDAPGRPGERAVRQFRHRTRRLCGGRIDRDRDRGADGRHHACYCDRVPEGPRRETTRLMSRRDSYGITARSTGARGS